MLFNKAYQSAHKAHSLAHHTNITTPTTSRIAYIAYCNNLALHSRRTRNAHTHTRRSRGVNPLSHSHACSDRARRDAIHVQSPTPQCTYHQYNIYILNTAQITNTIEQIARIECLIILRLSSAVELSAECSVCVCVRARDIPRSASRDAATRCGDSHLHRAESQSVQFFAERRVSWSRTNLIILKPAPPYTFPHIFVSSSSLSRTK